MSSQTTATSKSTLQGQYAGFVSRFLAILIDILLVIAIMVVVGFVAQLILSFFRLDTLLASAFDSMSRSSGIAQTLLRGAAAFGSFYFFFYLYYALLHAAAAGVTIGKALIGLRVVRMDGLPLTVGRCTRRYITFLLAALPLFLGLLWVIIDDRRQGWHDKLSNTCVIYDWPAQEDEFFLSRLKNRLTYMQETRSRQGSGTGGGEDEAVEEGSSA
jgi:uncharacterized RDD family membrane protein YckC